MKGYYEILCVLVIEIIFKKVNATNTVYPLSMPLCELKFNSEFNYIWKTFEDCFVSFAGNPLPKKINSHAIVSIGGDIIVIGGWDDYLYDQSTLYKLSCQNEDCQWTTLPQSLKFPRRSMVAIAIPDDFFYCN